MSNLETVSREFFDKPLDFTYEGRDYIWYGEYIVINTNPRVEVEVLYTDFCAYYRDFSDVLLPVIPTNVLISQIKIELEKSKKKIKKDNLNKTL
jgi:hypothetical protein